MKRLPILLSTCIIAIFSGQVNATKPVQTQSDNSTSQCKKDENWCQIKADASKIAAATASIAKQAANATSSAAVKTWNKTAPAREQISKSSKSAYDKSKDSMSQAWDSTKQGASKTADTTSEWGSNVKNAVLGKDMKDQNTTSQNPKNN